MKKILIFLIIVPLNLWASCLRIGFHNGVKCYGNSVSVDDLNINFSTTMQVSDNDLTVFNIPVYVYSNSLDTVSLTLEENQPLINGTDTINTKFYHVVHNHEEEITLGKPFLLLGNKRPKRNGHARVAFIRIKVNALSDIQTAGMYVLKKNLKTTLKGVASPTSLLTAKGDVTQVTIVGFENVSSYTNIQLFKDAIINYGTLKFSQENSQTKFVYVKNNTTGECQISFKTSPLISKIDSNYQIKMSYFYKKDSESEQKIINDKPFTLIRGTSSGNKVGEMRFVTEELKGAFIAGEYTATIQVTITAN